MEINPEWESEKNFVFVLASSIQEPEGNQPFPTAYWEGREVSVFRYWGGGFGLFIKCNKLEGKRLFLSEQSTHVWNQVSHGGGMICVLGDGCIGVSLSFKGGELSDEAPNALCVFIDHRLYQVCPGEHQPREILAEIPVLLIRVSPSTA